MGFLANLSPQQRLLVLGGGGLGILLVIIILIVALVSGGKKGNQDPYAQEQAAGYETVFRHLEPKEQDEAAAALKTKKISQFKFTATGDLLVAKDKVAEARVALGEAQVPKNPSHQGLEIFNKKDFISTDFDKKIAFMRALNGELTRLVRKVDGVDDATVLVNMPEDTLFQQEKKPITATVMVKMLGERSLSATQVEGLQHMCASAVPGLMTDNVTVVDERGGLLSSGLESNAGNQEDRLMSRQIDQQIRVTRALETDLQNSLQLLLDKLVGTGKSIVRVKLELDFDKQQVRNRLMAPVTANGEPLPNSKAVSRETIKGNNQSGGVPGTAANVPNYPLVPLLPGQSTGSSSKGETIRENIREQNAFSQKDQIVQTASGNIKRMSIAVLLPETVRPEAVDKLRNVIATAAGADPVRRDQVTVERVKFDTSLIDQLKAQIEKQGEEKKTALKKTGGIGWSLVLWGSIIAFIIATLIVLLTRRRRPPENPFEALTTSLDTDSLPNFQQGALGGLPSNTALGYGSGSGLASEPFGPSEAFSAPASYDMPPAAGGLTAPDTEGPFNFLYSVAPEQVAELLATERPATVAGILAQLDNNFAEAVIAHMPMENQTEIFSRLSQGATLPAMTQRMVSQHLRRKLGVPA
ncbi:MAG: flagellar M-ring protein FliF [Cyanobacteria bacterium NC_groundwater_1444_Ag_S-0.65um_54_12]|nr:flagellar M-ring protein FliF [Cyanobacteria bacterium NC_groundwater_1444_Ag_S-0.65um_54_12]